jgi:D-3-phosphoglycerate dehydrogenase / 2-oxoglutarate reductase
LGDHNVDKQMTDSRGDVSNFTSLSEITEDGRWLTNQVAYLMADISDVDNATIKDLYEQLESLQRKFFRQRGLGC